MDLSPEQITEINQAIEKLETLDPADIPEPAADLVALLNSILEETDET
jgi:hypothetical protein